MFGYVKKDTLLDEIRDEMDTCQRMVETFGRLVESLRRDGADPMTIQSHEVAEREWITRWNQSKRILSMLERAQ